MDFDGILWGASAELHAQLHVFTHFFSFSCLSCRLWSVLWCLLFASFLFLNRSLPRRGREAFIEEIQNAKCVKTRRDYEPRATYDDTYYIRYDMSYVKHVSRLAP